MEQLRTELADAVAKKKAKATADADAAAIRSRYGITPKAKPEAQAVPADAPAGPPANFDPAGILAALGAEHIQPVPAPMYSKRQSSTRKRK
ncbi:hypothetical protein D3C78_1839800 [compost metagenome]